MKRYLLSIANNAITILHLLSEILLSQYDTFCRFCRCYVNITLIIMTMVLALLMLVLALMFIA